MSYIHRLSIMHMTIGYIILYYIPNLLTFKVTGVIRNLLRSYLRKIIQVRLFLELILYY